MWIRTELFLALGILGGGRGFIFIFILCILRGYAYGENGQISIENICNVLLGHRGRFL